MLPWKYALVVVGPARQGIIIASTDAGPPQGAAPLETSSIMSKTYWLIRTTDENFEITREHGFSVQGIDSRQRRKAVRMGPDDRIVYYVSDLRRFAATATVTSEHFEEHTRLWKHHQEKEDFPHRVRIRPDVVLGKERYLDGLQIGPRLEYVKKWAPEQWHLALVGTLHIIPQRDFSFLESEMRRLDSHKSRRRGGRRRGRRGRAARVAAAGSGENPQKAEPAPDA